LSHQVRLDEYIANNVSEYVSNATLLAENLDQLRDLRSQLRCATASSPLCDAASLTSFVEEQYEKMLVAKP
jgi:predicted O-linked N-acetylglucosamine transferase (SPINDLY family)